jgi:hypothetical protein
MPVIYAAQVRQPRWIAGAQVVADLRIENNAATPFETPDPMYRTSSQPHFELTGPDGRKQEFQPDSQATDWDRAQQPTMLRLAPGEHWEGDLVLSRYADLESAGRYTLRSWIDYQGSRLESPPSQFEIVPARTLDLAAETSLGEDNTRVVECIELLEGGLVASSILRERDPRNAELLPFQRIERGATDPSATAILAPYSNSSVGLSALRWIVAESHHTLVVGHNLSDARRSAFGGAELSRVLPPVAAESGLYLAGVRGVDLLLTRITGSEDGVEAGPVWTVEKLAAPPDAAALTLSPAGAGNILLFVLAWKRNKATEVRLLTVSPAGKVIARADHTLPDVFPLGPAAAAWSTTGHLRASLLVRSAAEEIQIRAEELPLRPDLMLDGASRASEPVPLDSPLHDARLSYFETVPGQLSRVALLRASGGQTWVIPADGSPRPPQTAIPSAGPVALLPGLMHWYAVWPANGLLSIAPL